MVPGNPVALPSPEQSGCLALLLIPPSKEHRRSASVSHSGRQPPRWVTRILPLGINALVQIPPLEYGLDLVT